MISMASPPDDNREPASKKGLASWNVASATPTDSGPRALNGVCMRGSSQSTQKAPWSMTSLAGSNSAGRAGVRRLVPPGCFLACGADACLDAAYWACSSGSTSWITGLCALAKIFSDFHGVIPVTALWTSVFPKLWISILARN